MTNSTPKTSIRRKDLGDLLYMLPILCQISLPWQQGSLPWQRGLIARPQQHPTRCKDLDDISYTNWVIVYFISNFVAMATGVGRRGICLTAFNSPTPKTPCCVQESRRYLPQKPSYCLFCFKFLLPWQQGLVVLEFVWHRSIAQHQNPLLSANISVIFPIQVKLWPILSQISLPWQRQSVFLKFLWRHSIAWPWKPLLDEKISEISLTQAEL